MLAGLSTAEIASWLTRVAQTLDRSLREPTRTQATRMLDEGLTAARAGLSVLTQIALLDDCLRVAHLAIEADGRVEAFELERVSALAHVAAVKYFAAMPGYEAFAEGALSLDEVARFLATYRDDPRPFGFGAAQPWRGLELARRVEASTRNAGPLRDHERMLACIMDTVFGSRSTAVERTARRRLHDLFEPPPTVGIDPRATAFCRADGPEIFGSVAHGSQIHTRDPYDVESIHAEARDVFHRLVERAATPEHHHAGHGRTLLVLGESGCGKTHLLRALRTQVHAQRRGYVGYLQMTSEVGDYARYVLRSLVDSMERPYDAPTLTESSLLYLSDGLVEGRVAIPPAEVERLRTADLSSTELDATVGAIIDRILRTDGLERLEVDLLHALLLLQRRDPALQRRVIRFLRCEPLTTYDRGLLGGLAARDQPEDPLRTLVQLARIMWELHMAAMVLVVDQIEEVVPDGATVTRLQQAFDSLRAIADGIPSAIVVISCLDDVYSAVRPKLSQSLVDRLEHEPTPVRLTSQRQPDEIEHMLACRLEHLYAFFDVPWRDDDPTFPFGPTQIEAVAKFRARDVLAKFREYHAASIAAGALVPIAGVDRTAEPVAPASPAVDTTVASAAGATFDFATAGQSTTTPTIAHPALDRLWAESVARAVAAPESEDDVLSLVETTLQAAASELEVDVLVRSEGAGATRRLLVEARGSTRIVALCNFPPQGGHLLRQLESLRTRASQRPGAIPIALRNSDFQFGNGTATSKKIGELRAAGGIPIALEERELRAAVVARELATKSLPGFDAWRRLHRPVASLAFVRELLGLDVAAPLTSAPADPQPPSIPEPPRVGSGAAIPSGTLPSRNLVPVPVHPDQVRLGVTTTMRAEPQLLSLTDIKTHVAFLGTTGSGKTTAALHVVEQLLERGVSTLLVDRKGDLARYASEAWWHDATTPDHDRRRALREKIDIALYTPGTSAGRPLRLPLVPSLADASRDERDRLALFAASGLAAMMGYGAGTAHGHKRSVLQCAIELHTGEREITLDLLLDTIDRPDPDLLRRVGNLQRHFAPLSEDLQSLKIQRSALLTGEGELLDVAACLPPAGGRPRLTIINTAGLAEVPVLQFWVSRLLVELARLARGRPSPTLQGVAFFDEADAYVPAQSSPPTKEPMFDLLRRARSGGIGILLATQNPGDFDYRARENIGTWLVGKVAQERAIDKMRNLLGAYPNVGGRLATQSTGQFFVLTTGRAVEIRCDRSLMETSQLSEAEVAELARGTR